MVRGAAQVEALGLRAVCLEIMDRPTTSPLATLISRAILVTSLVYVMQFVLSAGAPLLPPPPNTHSRMHAHSAHPFPCAEIDADHESLDVVENVCAVVLVFEVLARVAFNPSLRAAASSPVVWVDVIALVPW